MRGLTGKGFLEKGPSARGGARSVDISGEDGGCEPCQKQSLQRPKQGQGGGPLECTACAAPRNVVIGLVFVLFGLVLEIKPRGGHTLGKFSATELHPPP